MSKTNAWGEPVDPENPSDVYWVPEDQRKDTDTDDDLANALDDETGDDLDGWQPGDPIE